MKRSVVWLQNWSNLNAMYVANCQKQTFPVFILLINLVSLSETFCSMTNHRLNLLKK